MGGRVSKRMMGPRTFRCTDMKTRKPIRKPEDHDWTGCRCTFTGELGPNGPVIGDNGRILPGDTKIKGKVTGQTYLGPSQKYNLIPDFELEVEGKSKAVMKIGLLDNNFQLTD